MYTKLSLIIKSLGSLFLVAVLTLVVYRTSTGGQGSVVAGVPPPTIPTPPPAPPSPTVTPEPSSAPTKPTFTPTSWPSPTVAPTITPTTTPASTVTPEKRFEVTCVAIVDIEHLAMRSRPFGDVQNDLEEATFSKGDRVRVKGWVQLDGGPKWFYVERSEAQFLWVSGYVFQKGEAVRTLKVDDGCPLGDIYTNDFYMDPPEGIPRLAQLSSWETSTAPCMCKIVFDMVKVYDTPFEPYQGERNYGKLNVGDEVRVIGWYQEDEGTKWFQISSAEQVFWIKGTEYHADGDKLVIKANPACEVANIYDEKYRLIQPLRDAEQ